MRAEQELGVTHLSLEKTAPESSCLMPKVPSEWFCEGGSVADPSENVSKQRLVGNPGAKVGVGPSLGLGCV